MDKDTDREGLRFPLRYNLIGIDYNSWGLTHIHYSLTYSHMGQMEKMANTIQMINTKNTKTYRK